MGKTIKIYIGLLVLLLIIMVYSDSGKPKKINWTPSFNLQHKRPWGTYVLYHELKNILPDNKIQTVQKTPYIKLRNTYDYNRKSNYIFLNNRVDIDNKSIDELLDYVAFGNNAFIISQSFPKYLRDTLKFKSESITFSSPFIEKKYTDDEEEDADEIAFYLSNKKLNPKKYFYKRGIAHSFFKELDTYSTTILGYNNIDGEEKINFVKIKYGKGYFYLNMQPYAFTNYHMLKENHGDYASSVLSYITDDSDVLWDRSSKYAKEVINSDLRFIMSKKELKWAWRLGLLGLLLFAIFMAKRRQRIIAIITPLKNSTVAFAKTIGELYFEQGEPKDILYKKINYFLEFIREKYLIDTSNLNDNFVNKVYKKSGVPKDQVQKLVHHIIYVNKKRINTENDIIVLNKLIEQFYKKTKL